jgi:hypothetical protein
MAPPALPPLAELLGLLELPDAVISPWMSKMWVEPSVTDVWINIAAYIGYTRAKSSCSPRRVEFGS